VKNGQGRKEYCRQVQKFIFTNNLGSPHLAFPASSLLPSSVIGEINPGTVMSEETLFFTSIEFLFSVFFLSLPYIG
jgi:hypothetical protein